VTEGDEHKGKQSSLQERSSRRSTAKRRGAIPRRRRWLEWRRVRLVASLTAQRRRRRRVPRRPVVLNCHVVVSGRSLSVPELSSSVSDWHSASSIGRSVAVLL